MGHCSMAHLHLPPASCTLLLNTTLIQERQAPPSHQATRDVWKAICSNFIKLATFKINTKLGAKEKEVIRNIQNYVENVF